VAPLIKVSAKAAGCQIKARETGRRQSPGVSAQIVVALPGGLSTRTLRGTDFAGVSPVGKEGTVRRSARHLFRNPVSGIYPQEKFPSNMVKG